MRVNKGDQSSSQTTTIRSVYNILGFSIDIDLGSRTPIYLPEKISLLDNDEVKLQSRTKTSREQFTCFKTFPSVDLSLHHEHLTDGYRDIKNANFICLAFYLNFEMDYCNQPTFAAKGWIWVKLKRFYNITFSNQPNYNQQKLDLTTNHNYKKNHEKKKWKQIFLNIGIMYLLHLKHSFTIFCPCISQLLS